MGDFERPHPFELPAGCEDCPEQHKSAEAIDKLQFLRSVAQKGAETLVGEEGEEFDQFILRAFEGDQENAAQLTTEFRQLAAQGLDELTQSLEKETQRSLALATSCDTPLKMRAAKGGREYTVRLCTSALMYMVNDQQPQDTTTHVWVNTDERGC